MRRAYTPVSRRLAARTPSYLSIVMQARSSSGTGPAQGASTASTPRPLRIRSRGYGPSSDLLKGIPDGIELTVEATLHPEDAEVQRMVLALSMPELAAVHVTPVRPHGSYENKVPSRTGAVYPDDVMNSTEREVMEQCLKEQLAAVANLVVDQVEQRTGRKMDAMQVTYADHIKSFSELVLNCMHDELRQLRAVRERPSSGSQGSRKSAKLTAATDSSGPAEPIDVEALARMVSARVTQEIAKVSATANSTAIADQIKRLEKKAMSHMEQLQQRLTAAVRGSNPLSSSNGAEDTAAAVVEAVEKATSAQQESLTNLIEGLLASRHDQVTGSATVDMTAVNEAVEGAVQSATDELRRAITSEVKKIAKLVTSSSGGGNSEGSDAGLGVGSELTTEIEKVFDLVQSTQNRLVAVDETVGDMFKEQASTREALAALQQLMQQQLEELRTAASTSSSSVPATPTDSVFPATTEKMAVALDRLHRDVSNATSMLTIHQEEMQRQLTAVAQVVSESVSAAIRQNTEDSVKAAMETVQEQLQALRHASDAAVAAATTTKPSPMPSSPPPATQPIPQEVLTDALESVLSPRWADLSVQVERMNTTNQLAIEQQLLHIADSVSTSVSASIGAHLEELRAAAQSLVAAKEREIVTEDDAGSKDREAIEKKVEGAATALMERTTQELATLKKELMQAVQTEAGKTQEVNLTPMYKYIDSVLAFLKEEFSMQETNMTAKMTSLADSLTMVIQSQEGSAMTAATGAATKAAESAERAAAAAAVAATAATEAAAASSAQMKRLEEQSKLVAPPLAREEKPAPTAPPVPSSLTADLAPLFKTLETNTSVLRGLESRLEDVGRGTDVSAIVDRLQETSEQFRASAAAATAAQNAERTELRAFVHDQFGSLKRSIESRDAQLLEAMRAAATSQDMCTQFSSMQDALQSMTSAQKAELLTALRDTVSSSEKEQAERAEVLLGRLTAMQESLLEQQKAVQLLQPSPAMTELTLEQRQTYARIRVETQAHVRRISSLVNEIADSPNAGSSSVAGKKSSTVVKALQDELAGLRKAHEEEAGLQRGIADTDGAERGVGGTVQSIVHTELQRLEEELQKGMEGLRGQDAALQECVSTAVKTLLGKMEEVEGSAGGLPTLEDIQLLLDATVVRIKSDAKEGVNLSEVMEVATSRSAEMLKSTVQTTLAESLSAAEERLIPSYHSKVESSLQTHQTAQSNEFKTFARSVADITSAAVQSVEEIVRDFTSRHERDEEKRIAMQNSLLERQAGAAAASAGVVTAKPITTVDLPFWWLLLNPTLVFFAVLLCMYHIGACLLLAFVPIPSEADSNVAVVQQASGSGSPNASSSHKSSRYVDQYM